jgi:PAS domain S-box-containing protein
MNVEKSNQTEREEKLNTLISLETSKLKTIINAIPDLVWLKDKEGVYLACNKRFEDLYGATEEEIIGKTDYDFVDKELADFFRQHDINAMNADIPLTNFENLPFASDGHIEYVQTTKTKVLDEYQNIIGVLGIGRDFTEEKIAKEKIESQKQELETIFNTTKDGIAITDLESNFKKVNKAYTQITGLNQEELLKTSCLNLTHPDDVSFTKEKMILLFKEGHVDNYEKRCLINGKTIIVSISATILPDGNHMLISMKDISKFKLLEERAKLASMGEMIGNIAHQWRQPLSVITTMASGIQLKKELGMLHEDTLNESMETIVDQANYLSHTIDDFRNFIRNVDEEMPLDIKTTLLKTLSIVSAALKNHDITVIQNIEDTITINGHENDLIQSFINIINNARDAIEENVSNLDDKFIFVTTKTAENGVIVSIKDNGGGIPQDIINKIFEPYFTTKHQSTGTGIGLSMTHQLLEERHHAQITVQNVEYDYQDKIYKGACFEILFRETTNENKEE